MAKIVCVVVTQDGIKTKCAMDLALLAGSGVISGFVHNEGSLVVPARNSATLGALQHYPDATHLLFVDADVVGITPNLVQKLVMRDVGVIGPLTNKRQAPYQPHPREPEDIDKVVEQLSRPAHERGIIEVRGMSLGCCLVKVEVLQKIAEIHEEKNKDGTVDRRINWFASERIPRKTILAEANELVEELQKKYKKDHKTPLNAVIEEAVKEALALGIHSRIHGELVGEDYHFFENCRSNGFKVYIDMQLHVGHIGNYIYNIDDWLATGMSRDNVISAVRDPHLTAWDVKPAEKKYIEVPYGGNFKIPKH